MTEEELDLLFCEGDKHDWMDTIRELNGTLGLLACKCRSLTIEWQDISEHRATSIREGAVYDQCAEDLLLLLVELAEDSAC